VQNHFVTVDRQSLLGSHQQSWWFNMINYTHFVDEEKGYPYHVFLEGDLTPGQTYYITVTATDYSLNESNFSIELDVFIEP
jgi:hypothetical protein